VRADGEGKTLPKTVDIPDLGSKYKVLGVLGSGAMGQVYKARQILLDRVVAIKVIAPELLENKESLQRALREARLSAQLNHPNIVQVHDVEYVEREDEFSICIVSEFVNGQNLSDYLEQRPLLPFDAAVDFVKQLCDALVHAHERGVIHRDIKPDNILVLEDGKIKLADFGLAKTIEQKSTVTKTGVILGTPLFMAPEQIARPKGARLTASVDIYATGVLSYVLLCGKPPFQSEDPLAVMRMQLEASPPRLRSINPTISHSLEKVVLQALDKSPSNRQPSIEAFKKAFCRAAKPAFRPASHPVPKPALRPASQINEQGGQIPAREALVKPRRRYLEIACVLMSLCLVILTVWWLSCSAKLSPEMAMQEIAELRRITLRSPGVPSQERCAALGGLVRAAGLSNAKSLSADAEDSALGLYYLASSTRKIALDPERAFGLFEALLERHPRDLAGGETVVLVEFVECSIGARSWHRLAEALDAWGTQLKQPVPGRVIAVMLGRVGEAFRVVRGDLIDDRELLDNWRAACRQAVGLMEGRSWEEIPEVERSSALRGYFQCQALRGASEVRWAVRSFVEKTLSVHGDVWGLHAPEYLRLAAIVLAFSGSTTEGETITATQWLRRAEAASRDYDEMARLAGIRAVILARAPRAGSLSPINGLKEGLGAVSPSHIDRLRLESSTRAFIVTVDAYLNVCTGDAKRSDSAKKLMESIEREDFEPNDVWWFHRVWSKYYDSVYVTPRASEQIGQAVGAVPIEYFNYVSDLYRAMP